MATNRTCHTCGKRYYYCPNCDWEDRKDKPTWMVMFDCENCLKIWNILTDYAGFHKFSKEEAIDKLLECDLREVDSFPAKIRELIYEIMEEPVGEKSLTEEEMPQAPKPEYNFVSKKKRRK